MNYVCGVNEERERYAATTIPEIVIRATTVSRHLSALDSQHFKLLCSSNFLSRENYLHAIYTIRVSYREHTTSEERERTLMSFPPMKNSGIVFINLSELVFCSVVCSWKKRKTIRGNTSDCYTYNLCI